MDLKTKRIYERPSKKDGLRILVDRLWPRGLSKEKAKIEHWAKDVSPSPELRKWYGHDPGKWDEFKKYYFRELDKNPATVTGLLERIESGPATLLFAARETRYNNAVALKEYLENRAARWQRDQTNSTSSTPPSTRR